MICRGASSNLTSRSIVLYVPKPNQHTENGFVSRPFHEKRPENGARALRESVEQGLLTRDEAHLIFEFVNFVIATENIGGLRTLKFFGILNGWRRWIGPNPDNNIRDLRAYQSPIFQSIKMLQTNNKIILVYEGRRSHSLAPDHQ